MKRRQLLQGVIGVPLLAGLWARRGEAAPTSRVRPGDPGWPTEAEWQDLRAAVGGG